MAGRSNEHFSRGDVVMVARGKHDYRSPDGNDHRIVTDAHGVVRSAWKDGGIVAYGLDLPGCGSALVPAADLDLVRKVNGPLRPWHGIATMRGKRSYGG